MLYEYSENAYMYIYTKYRGMYSYTTHMYIFMYVFVLSTGAILSQVTMLGSALRMEWLNCPMHTAALMRNVIIMHLPNTYQIQTFSNQTPDVMLSLSIIFS